MRHGKSRRPCVISAVIKIQRVQGYTVADVNSAFGIAELGASATTHMIKEGNIIEVIEQRLAHMKPDKWQTPLTWPTSDRD